jgi:hypothetical protein
MKLYHGSPVRNITEFHLENIRFESVEGYGTYFTHDYRIAREYAGSEGSVYECQINGAVFDATSTEAFCLMISQINNKIKFDLNSVEYLKETINGLVQGQYQISDHAKSGLTWQILNLLDNNESFHSIDNKEEIIQIIQQHIKEYMADHCALKYIDLKLGITYVCKDPSCIKILKEITIGSIEDEESL